MKYDVIELDYKRLDKSKLMDALTEAFPDWYGEQDTRPDASAINGLPEVPETTSRVAHFSLTGRQLTYPASTPRDKVEAVIESHYSEIEA